MQHLPGTPGSKKPLPANGKRRRSPITDYCLLALLAIPAIQPVLRTGLTCGFDNVFHLWRAVQMAELLRHGVWFSRWAPHMAQGYGYPLYLFQSPLSAYLVAILNLAGVAWPVALNGVYAAAIVLSGWTMWLLARDLWGERGAWVTAVAYLYAPFHAYVAFYRASLSETVAWAILPLLLWGLRRWQVNGTRQALVTAVLAFIALVFTHDVTAYAFLPFIVGWIGTLAMTGRSWQSALRGMLMLALGMGGSAFFWLPAILERHYVQFERAGSAWPFLYFHNFLPLPQLFALPRNADPLLLNDWPERGLGVLLAALAVGGAVLAWQRLPAWRGQTAYLALALAGYVVLTTEMSRPLWDAAPLLQNFQFPWRFLAPATFVAALLSGGLVTEERNPFSAMRDPITAHRSARTAHRLLFLIPLLSVAHWGWFYPQQCAAPADLSLEGMVAWEAATETLGTTASRELLPITVPRLPQDAPGDPVWTARLDGADLPEDARILRSHYEPLRAEIEVETAVPFMARFRAFYFPGWRAWVDGEPASISATAADGLISFAVPDGRHTLVVAFEETPLRRLADTVSLFSLVLLAVAAWLAPGAVAEMQRRPARRQQLWILLVVALALLAGKWLLADAGRMPVRQERLAGAQLASVANPTDLTFGDPANPDMVRLLGYDAWQTAVPTDEPLAVSLYWQAVTPLPKAYRVGLVVVDENGIRWSEEGLRDYRWTRAAPPTQVWPAMQYVQTAYYVDLLPGTPPGRYTLQLSLFDEQTFAPLAVHQFDQPPAPFFALGALTVLPPRRQPVAAPLTPLFSSQAAEELTLFRAEADRQTAAPGDVLLFQLEWAHTGNRDTAVTLSLLDHAGHSAGAWELSLPAYGRGIWLSQHRLTLPIHLENGEHDWQLMLADTQAIPLHTLTVVGPERVFTAPEMKTAVNIHLTQNDTPLASLAGYSLNEDSCDRATAVCEITLQWQALHEMSATYRVFVQLLGSDGAVAAQTDSIPANWTRPTTGWLPGEFITDQHQIPLPPNLPPGAYRVITGLYDEAGTRLTTLSGLDHIPLLTIDLPPDG